MFHYVHQLSHKLRSALKLFSAEQVGRYKRILFTFSHGIIKILFTVINHFVHWILGSSDCVTVPCVDLKSGVYVHLC